MPLTLADRLEETTTDDRDDLDDTPDGYELVDGELVEKPVGAKSSWVGGRLYAALDAHCRNHRAGWAFPPDTGFACFPGKKSLRKPDAAVIRSGRMAGGELPDGYFRTPPDVAAEVVSPLDNAYDLEQKVADYLGVGVALVWVIFPNTRTARVHRPDRTISHVGEDDRLDGEGVLPGFAVRLADLFFVPSADPPPAA